MEIPWPTTYPPGNGTPNGSDVYRLCAGCHGVGPFTDSLDMNTNFVSDGINRHVHHLAEATSDFLRYPSDWSGADSSRMTCVSCHNVHGSTRLAMVRDGKLTGREPGQQIWYNNDDLVIYSDTNSDPPDPESLPLSASTGVIYIPNSADSLCTSCHNNDNTVPEYRSPYQDVSVAPVLAWTGENGYGNDGVDPEAGASGSTFTFRVMYSDNNNDPPTAMQVWVDRNDDGDYDDTGEKSDMAPVLSGDDIYFDGRLYVSPLSLEKAGDNTLSYRFYASDGMDATGNPTSDSAVSVVNNAPVLSWTGEQYYLADGVNPDSGGDGATYRFRVTYTDGDNEAPASIGVWIDEDDSGAYEAGEWQELGEDDIGDTDCRDGKIFAAPKTLSYAGDGVLTYTFQASDGTDSASADPGPLADSTVTVAPTANNPPSLDWAAADCLTEGVRPGSGADGADFEFMVSYSDPDNECPASAGGEIGVWIDEDDSGLYEPGEGHDLIEYDPGDTDCTDGKIYGTTLPLAAAGDGDLAYTFVATDGIAAAAGTPTSDREVTVAVAAKVRLSGGTGWETSIQTAVNNHTGLILVYPNADFAAAVYPQTLIMSKPGRTIRSVCGPGLTVVEGSTYGVKFQTSSNIEIDGFTLTGASRGLEVLGGDPVTVRNCVISGNSTSGIYAYNNAGLVVEDCEIFSNGVSASQGGGIYINSGTHSIRDSVIRNNSATLNGGGLFLQNAAGGVTIEDTSVLDNTAPSGGGLNVNNSNVILRGSVIAGNIAVNDGGGMYQTGTPNVSLENCLLVDNEATRGGGAYINDDEAATLIVNTTVADNRAVGGDGGAFNLNCAEITARNIIFWNNSATGQGHTVFKSGCGAADSIVTDSIATTGSAWLYGGTWVTGGNIDPARDPMFLGAGDYHLQWNSPAIDAANASYAPAVDIDGDPRPQGAADDIGADEYLP
jgi:parallel beta-helix repeat protein